MKEKSVRSEIVHRTEIEKDRERMLTKERHYC
jgi:hypothetical protein